MPESSTKILEAVSQQLDVSPDQLEDLRGFENLVYLDRSVEGGRILRLTAESHRTKDLLLAELDWVRFLAGEGISVARALRWPSGERVEVVTAPDGDRFFATLFEVAPGEAVDVGDLSVWNDVLFERWGALLGRMHVASRRYDVAPGAPKRLHWHEDTLLEARAFVPDEHAAVVDAGRRIVDDVAELPVSDETYGLVHGDVHQGNIFAGRDSLTVFDFDDSSYHFFVHDLAMALYYACWWSAEGDAAGQNAFAEMFMGALLRGYRRHADLPSEWLARIPLFLSLRDFTIFVVIHKRLDVDALAGPLKTALEERRARLLGGGTKIDIDFGGL